jgi:hypothetical protein
MLTFAAGLPQHRARRRRRREAGGRSRKIRHGRHPRKFCGHAGGAGADGRRPTIEQAVSQGAPEAEAAHAQRNAQNVTAARHEISEVSERVSTTTTFRRYSLPNPTAPASWGYRVGRKPSHFQLSLSLLPGHPSQRQHKMVPHPTATSKRYPSVYSFSLMKAGAVKPSLGF